MRPTEQTVERRALESAVSNSLYLRGLGLVPIGLFIVFGVLAMWEVGPLRYTWVVYVSILLLPASLWINRYYDEHYGRATRSTRHRVRASVICFVVLPLAIGGWLLISWSDLPLNGFAIVFGLILLMVSASTVGLRKHRVIIWGSVLVAGLLPIWNDDPDASVIGSLIVGVGYIAMGIFDHRLLARIAGPRADRSLETRDAGA